MWDIISFHSDSIAVPVFSHFIKRSGIKRQHSIANDSTQSCFKIHTVTVL